MTTPIAFLRQMLDSGMDLQMAMDAAEAFEASAKTEHDRLVTDLLDRLSVDAKAEKRRAKDRARKAADKAARGIPRNSADSVELAEAKDVPPTPPSESNPIPPLKGGTFPQTEDVTPLEKPKKPLTTWATEIWAEAPLVGRQRSGKAQAETALKAAVKRGADPAAVKAGLAAYYASHDATKNHAEFAAGVHRAIQRDLWQSYAPQPETPLETEDPWPRRLLNWRVNAYWNSDWGPKPGKPGYVGPESEIAA